MFCQKCGKEIQAGTNFCPDCGCRIEIHQATELPNFTVVSTSNAKNVAGSKLPISYFFSILSAVLTFFARVGMQRTYSFWENMLERREVIGLAEDIKPFLTIIPIIAAIIVSLLIVSDKSTNMQKKVIAFIWNGIFIALSLLFIWFDLPA